LIVLVDYLLKPVVSGIFGFTLFLIVILISKFIEFEIGAFASFQIEVSDLYLSFLGFLFLFLINLLKNIQKNYSLH
jgi:hypothetical protein